MAVAAGGYAPAAAAAAPDACLARLPLAAAVHGRPSALQSVKLRLQRLSPFTSSSQDANGIAAGSSDSAAGGSPRGGRASKRRSMGLGLRADAHSLGRRDTAAGAAAGAVKGVRPQLSSAFSSNDEEEGEAEGQQQPEAGVASALVQQGAPPDGAAAVAAAAGYAARQEAADSAADVVGRGSLSFSAHLPAVQRQQRHLEQHLGQQLSFDLEAQQQPAQAARVAAEAASAPHPSSAVFRRCCACLLPRLPWHRASLRRRVSTAVQRRWARAWAPHGWVFYGLCPACLPNAAAPPRCPRHSYTL